MQFTTVGELARRLKAKPRDISDLFYQQRLDNSRCQVVGGRRLIPLDYVEEIGRVLREAGSIECVTDGTSVCPSCGQLVTVGSRR